MWAIKLTDLDVKNLSFGEPFEKKSEENSYQMLPPSLNDFLVGLNFAISNGSSYCTL